MDYGHIIIYEQICASFASTCRNTITLLVFHHIQFHQYSRPRSGRRICERNKIDNWRPFTPFYSPGKWIYLQLYQCVCVRPRNWTWTLHIYSILLFPNFILLFSNPYVYFWEETRGYFFKWKSLRNIDCWFKTWLWREIELGTF